ncbi:LysE family translocator [Chelatococcus sp. SYSU_G07232]|uniref:LysE family translocator n=1 Tax=Chelatococcus albus TaxID=3047466 RepID=A0ABT7AHE5_9HYPH|nr:LysE family translocator [Chelatococcus sp. SYSU_G07232]MDJ1158811.1 LysE family translocator [Chelatococcus sp. SYSU_G07232]
MAPETWAAFVATSAVLLVIPGPTILLVVSYALGQGRRAAMPLVAGVALGDATAMTLSMLGLGALLATSATLFTALKWAGAAYLVYLGVKLWRADPTGLAEAAPEGRWPLGMLAHAWLVTSLNPKSIVFFVAFLPQFLDVSRPVLPQMAVFEATFVALAALNAFIYAFVAASARRAVRHPAALKVVNRTAGGLLVGAAIAAVAWKRAQ